MRRLMFVFRPGWIALALVVAGFAYLSLTVLAPWQLGKNTTTSRENNQIKASLSADPVAVTTFLPQQDSSAPDAQWRQVTATGRYLPAAQALARLRLIAGKPAYEVLTAFAVDNGPTVLVNRGFVRPSQGTEMPTVAPPTTGTVSITARLRDPETAPVEDMQPFRENGTWQVYAIDTRQVADATGTELTGSYLQLQDNQPGALNAMPLPNLDAGPFLSYGIQWIAFGILAPIGLGYFAYSEIRIRRREAAGRAAAEQSDAPVTVEDKLSDRYGGRR
jgi:cytochrome oxidase assembly protein ShyY1